MELATVSDPGGDWVVLGLQNGKWELKGLFGHAGMEY